MTDALEDRVGNVQEQDQLNGPASVESDQSGTSPVAASGGGPHREAMGEERRHQAMGGTRRHRQVAGGLGHADGAVRVGQGTQQLQGAPNGPELARWWMCISHSGMQFDRICACWSQFGHKDPASQFTNVPH